MICGMERIKGFSKLSRSEKIDQISKSLHLNPDFKKTLASFRHPEKQELFDDFSENTITNFYLPFGVAPNFLINNRMYMVPMVIEESSVVAAASRSAAFWADIGGFTTTIHNTIKTGHIWFKWQGDYQLLKSKQQSADKILRDSVSHISNSMEKRGGGIVKMEFLQQTELPDVFQLLVQFKTADSMGANFINSCLEAMKEPLCNFFISNEMKNPEIIMAILSNHTPECLVTCSVKCKTEQLQPFAGNLPAAEFAEKFKLAVDIARCNPHRAVTHNKGIYNGVDAVILATGNDFRAVEAAGHAFASLDGQYRSLSHCNITSDGVFQFKLTIPLAIGTVGGLTNLHPMASEAMKILQHPNAEELMSVAAAAGLANNFSAVASLVTTGIQKGHMKLHLSNILNSLNATTEEKELANEYFANNTVSVNAVKNLLNRT